MRMRVNREKSKMADANQKKRRGPKSYLTESARKRRKKESEQRRGEARIYISKEIDRWRKVKEDLALETDSKLAKLLLDSYEFKKISDKSTTSTGHIHMYSTPARRYIPPRECSESEVTISGREMSGVFVQECWKDMSLPGPSTSDFQNQHIQKADITTKEASSFINPFDLTIDVTENVDEDDQTTDDEDYEPSFDITLRSTAELENYHQLILMYAAKRFAYTPPVYKARTILAALDYNFHIDRETKTNADGSVRYHRTYNKKSGRWSAVPYKVKKKYSYISDLISAVVEKRLLDREGMHKSKTLSP
ncbi:uncharacterized protein LOC117336383 [Pecten maximus]|uniref:uncharacterized protein LOC117331514 n=1 Tax=Pecten maximus TaxID=6579 RepID=UPI00145873D4|nr:uncharacterized protein LOC117331514 [Pecten maximus]XP_033752778.1 uncharacterized protein LOC117336383 [Pecten maximus]